MRGCGALTGTKTTPFPPPLRNIIKDHCPSPRLRSELVFSPSAQLHAWLPFLSPHLSALSHSGFHLICSPLANTTLSPPHLPSELARLLTVMAAFAPPPPLFEKHLNCFQPIISRQTWDQDGGLWGHALLAKNRGMSERGARGCD